VYDIFQDGSATGTKYALNTSDSLGGVISRSNNIGIIGDSGAETFYSLAKSSIPVTTFMASDLKI